MNILPQKYAALKTAEKAGIVVPKTLLVDKKTEKKEIEAFVKSCRGQKNFIVRSAVQGEDGNEHSFAGHFWSSEKINCEKVYAQTKKALRENTKRMEKYGIHGKIFVMIQPFVDAKYGGVLFSRWKHYPNYFLGEISRGGSQKTVEGSENSFFLLHKKIKKHVIPLEKKYGFLEKKLQEVVKKIEKKFSFVADIEWAVNKKNEVVVLQIRPVTTSIEALFPALEKIKMPKGKWQKNALSESLGFLSPLSFDLVKKLFSGSRKQLREIGVEAEKINFLFRLPNGEILVDEEKEKNFWKNSSFFSPFVRGMQQQKKLEEVLKFAGAISNRPNNFSHLQKIFSWWMVSNIYAKIPEEKGNYSYELSKVSKSQSFKVTKFPEKNWKSMNSFLRELFFFELEKGKKEIEKKPVTVFMSFSEWKKESFKVPKFQSSKKKELQQREEEQVHNSIYDFSNICEENSQEKMQKVSGKKTVTAPTYIVENPYAHTKKIPHGVILIAPFFRNEWVWDLQFLAGVVLEQGGVLSHSAIVAREKNIPYFIHVKNATERFAKQKKLTLDCEKNMISSTPLNLPSKGRDYKKILAGVIFFLSGALLLFLFFSSQNSIPTAVEGNKKILFEPVTAIFDTEELGISGGADIFIDGDYAYVTGYHDDALQIFDISNPEKPFAVTAIFDTKERALDGAHGILVHEGYAYVAGYDNSGVQIIDVRDPKNPIILDAIFDTKELGLGGAHDIVVKNNYAFVSGYYDHAIQVLDVSDKENIIPVSVLFDTEKIGLNGAHDIVLDGNYLYVASEGDQTLQMIDLSDPENIIPVLSLSDTRETALDGIHDVDIFGDFVLATASYDYGVQFFDKTNLTPKGRFFDYEETALSGAVETAFMDELMIVAGFYDNGITILDASDPTWMTHVQSIFDTKDMALSSPNGVAVKDEYVFVVSYGESGLQVLKKIEE